MCRLFGVGGGTVRREAGQKGPRATLGGTFGQAGVSPVVHVCSPGASCAGFSTCPACGSCFGFSAGIFFFLRCVLQWGGRVTVEPLDHSLGSDVHDSLRRFRRLPGMPAQCTTATDIDNTDFTVCAFCILGPSWIISLCYMPELRVDEHKFVWHVEEPREEYGEFRRWLMVVRVWPD